MQTYYLRLLRIMLKTTWHWCHQMVVQPHNHVQLYKTCPLRPLGLLSCQFPILSISEQCNQSNHPLAVQRNMAHSHLTSQSNGTQSDLSIWTYEQHPAIPWMSKIECLLRVTVSIRSTGYHPCWPYLLEAPTQLLRNHCVNRTIIQFTMYTHWTSPIPKQYKK